MDLNSLPLFAALQQKMSWINRRQVLLSENIANANTPGYKPKDLQAPNFGDLLSQYNHSGVTLAVTNPGHMRGAEDIQLRAASSGISESAPSQDIKKVKPDEVQPNGNGVSLEEQMVDMTNSQLDYNTLLDLYKADVGMINTVLDKGH